MKDLRLGLGDAFSAASLACSQKPSCSSDKEVRRLEECETMNHSKIITEMRGREPYSFGSVLQ
jgi:hypothetical protein